MRKLSELKCLLSSRKSAIKEMKKQQARSQGPRGLSSERRKPPCHGRVVSLHECYVAATSEGLHTKVVRGL